MALHATLRTGDQWSTIGISFCCLACVIPSNRAMAMSTLSTGVSWIDPTRENTRMVGFIFRVVEDASLHPECSFTIASFAVLALGRLKIAKVLKHHYGCLMLLSKLDNAGTDKVS